MPKVALYARVSTVEHKQDTELQLHDLRAYAQAHGWTDCTEYIDEGISGAKDSRPALDRLLSDCRKGRVKVILVWKLDRLSRSLKHLLDLLTEVQALNIGFVSYKEALDFTTPTGRLMFHVISAFSEFERDIIRERVKAGLANARRKGKRLGNKPKTLDLDLIHRLKGEGKSYREIARVHGGISYATVRRNFTKGEK